MTLRVVLDANVIISGVIAPQGIPAAILDAWQDGTLVVVTCPALLAEIEEKLRLPRIRRKYPLSDAVVLNVLIRLAQTAVLAPDTAEGLSPLVGLPDPDDAMLFAAATNAKADFIVTGDKKLLEFQWSGAARIVSPRQFWETEFPAR